MMASRSAAGDRVHRLGDRRPGGVFVVVHGQQRHDRGNNAVVAFPHSGGNWAVNVMQTGLLSWCLSVPRRDNKRCCRFDHELVHATGHAAHGVLGQRANSGHAVPFTDFLLAGKNRGGGQVPVDDLRRAPPRLFQARLYLRAVRRRVCGFWPHNGPPVAPGDQEKPLSCGGRSVVRRHQFPPFHGVAQGLQLAQPLVERLAG